MIRNMSSIDRAVRFLTALLILVLYLTGLIGGLTAIILGVIAAALLISSFLGFCPIYFVFKISTAKKNIKTA